ncbi:protease SohB [Veronia pacifica]|uniref:protease SohB n=1 Tax=Veronia pacifica TaxID=1080227 RepID=UPI00362C4E80
MEFLFEYGLFLLKAATIVVVVFAILAIIRSGGKGEEQPGELKVTNLTEAFKDNVSTMESHLFDDAAMKLRAKEEKKADKARAKEEKNKAKELAESGDLESIRKPQLFVIDFKGSIDAREVAAMREEVTAILSVAKADDEVLVRLESGGGMVHAYGLASSQLDRIKKAGVTLTISVDKVAASGGYMMACVADKIIAAPFAVVGSIGVIAQLPNFNKLLKKNDIDYEQLTAGEFKRTLTMFGENTDKAREKFQEELEQTHVLFKDFIADHRPDLELQKVATGEHWFGNQALPLGLIDEVGTSDDFLMAACKEERDILKVQYTARKKLVNKVFDSSSEAVDRLLLKWVARGQRPIV